MEMRPKPKLLLTIMAASMVAAAGLLLILLWQRRNVSHVANQGHPDEYTQDEHPQNYQRRR